MNKTKEELRECIIELLGRRTKAELEKIYRYILGKAQKKL